MPKAIAALLIWLVLAGAAAGDIVVMKDGKIHQGQVTRQGNRVLIKKALATIAVDAQDVERIIQSETPSTRPAEKPFAPTATLDTPQSAEDRFTRPESHVFLAMRQLAVMPSGPNAYTLSERIKQWRAKVHDRERKVRGKWISPKDMEQARDKYAEILGETRDLVSRIRRAGATTASGRAQQAGLRRSLATYFRRAAEVWPDDLMRDFLAAVADLEGLNYNGAIQRLRKCGAAAPRVAAFRQGVGAALAAQDRKIEALAEYLAVLHLQPDSRDAYQLVARAVDDAPGDLMADATFVLAKEILGLYEAPTRRPYLDRGITWLMPGRPWLGRELTLPTPPYDRLVFRQAVGVPIAKHGLLVDSGALEDALEIFVAIDAKTTVPAKAQRTSTFGTRARKPPPVELVAVEDFELAALKTDAEALPAKGQAVTFFGLNLYEEMGSEVRPVPAVIQQAGGDGALGVSEKLLAGEAAGPVITKDGQLVGFLEGKTDPMTDGGGDDRYTPVGELDSLLKQADRTRGSFGGYGRVKRKVTPKPAPGQYFVVFITAAEGATKKR